MEIILLILGSIFILTLFTVGESIYKHFHINKFFALVTILFLVVGFFLPNVTIYGYEISVSAVILPFAISFFALFKIQKFSRFFLSFLICVLTSIVFHLVNLDLSINTIVQPFLILAVGLGVVVGLVCYNLPSSIASIFFGVFFGNIIFNISKFETLENLFLSNEIFVTILVACISSSLILFLKQKIVSSKIQGTQYQNML